MGILSSILKKGAGEALTSSSSSKAKLAAGYMPFYRPLGYKTPAQALESPAVKYLTGKKAGQGLLPDVGEQIQIRARVEDNVFQSRAVREEKALLKLRRGDVTIPRSDNEIAIWGHKPGVVRTDLSSGGAVITEGPVGLPGPKQLNLTEQIDANPIHRLDAKSDMEAWFRVLRSHLGSDFNRALFPSTGWTLDGPLPLTAGPRGAVGTIKGMPITMSGGQLSKAEYKNFDSTYRSLARDYPSAHDNLQRLEISGFNSFNETSEILGEGASGLYRYTRFLNNDVYSDAVINLHHYRSKTGVGYIQHTTDAYDSLTAAEKASIGIKGEKFADLRRAAWDADHDPDRNPALANVLLNAREMENYEYPLSGLLNHEFGHAVQDIISPMYHSGSHLGISGSLTDEVLEAFGHKETVKNAVTKQSGWEYRGALEPKPTLRALLSPKPTILEQRELIDDYGSLAISRSIGSQYADTNMVESFAETFKLMREGVDSPAIRNFDDLVTTRSTDPWGRVTMRSGGEEGLEVPTAAIREVRNNPLKSGIGPRQGPEGRRRLQRVQPTFDRNAPSPKAGRDHAIREIGAG